MASKVPRNWKFDRIDEDNGVFQYVLFFIFPYSPASWSINKLMHKRSIYMPKTNLNIALSNDGSPQLLLQDRTCGVDQMWRFEPVRMCVERVGEEIVATSTVTTVTKVKVVTRVRKMS